MNFRQHCLCRSLAGLDEDVVADVERVPDLAELPGHVVAVGLRVLAQFGGPLRHLDRVLVVAHQEEDVEALHAAVAGLHVGAELLERGADVRPAVGVVDGGGLEPGLCGHSSSFRASGRFIPAVISSRSFYQTPPARRRFISSADGSPGPIS